MTVQNTDVVRIDAEKALAQEPNEELVVVAREEFGNAMGIQSADVDFLRVDWSRIMQRGAVATITFGYWRATITLSLEDIGINPETAEQREAIMRVIKLPQGRLLVGSPGIPDLSKIENKGRTLLNAYSVPTGLGRFVMLGEKDSTHPAAGWHLRELNTAVATIEREFYATRDAMGAAWDSLQTQTITYWSALADELYTNLEAADKVPTRGQLGIGAQWIDDPDGALLVATQQEWVAWFLNKKVRPNMLSKEEAMRRCKFAFSLRPVLPPKALLQAEAEATLDDAELQLRKMFIQKAGDTIDSFYRDILGEIRARLLETTSSALKAMSKPANDGKLPGPNQQALKSLIEYVQQVKTWPDGELEGQIAEMRAALDLPPETRATPEVSAELQSMFRRIAAEAKLTLYELDRADNLKSTRDLGIPDDDNAELEFVANRKRRDLGLMDESEDDVALNRTGRGRALA